MAAPVSEVMAPSPQTTVYDPVAGMVMDSPDCVVRHAVTNVGTTTFSSLDSAMPLPAASNRASASMSSCSVEMFSIAARCAAANDMVTADPDTVTLSPAPGVTPPEDWPESRRCILDLCTVELSISSSCMTRRPSAKTADRTFGFSASP